MTFGRYPDVSLSRVRERQAEERKLLADGADPITHHKAIKAKERIAHENSFASIAGKWMEHWQEAKSLRHVDSTRRRLATNILPSLGGRPIAEIEAPGVVAMVRLIEVRGARDLAKRALETTGQIFRYAIAHGFAKRNRAESLRGASRDRSERRRLEPFETQLRQSPRRARGLLPGTATAALSCAPAGVPGSDA